MKLFLAVVLCLVAATQARPARRARRDMQSVVGELNKKFPMEEWKAFYGKLGEALGSQKEEFNKQLEANKGDMDMTLDQFKDKMAGKFPQVKTMWDTQKTKFTALTEKLKTTTLKDIFDWGQDKLKVYTQNLNYNSVNDWWKDAQVYLATWFNQMQAQAQATLGAQ